ncbi:MAG: hypothetical protein ACYDAO_06225 [Thermoplasmataceae archaeon]
MIVSGMAIMVGNNAIHKQKNNIYPYVQEGNTAAQTQNLTWINTVVNSQYSPNKHTEITMKYSSFYNSNAKYIVYCLLTCVNAGNGANIKAGNSALGSGSTIHQTMLNPNTVTIRYVEVCHLKLLFGHWINVCSYVPVEVYSPGDFKVALPGFSYSPSGNINGMQIGSQTTSCTVSTSVTAGGSSGGASVGTTYGVSTTTNYYSFMERLLTVHQQYISWNKYDYQKGETTNHFITMASTFYLGGGQPTISLESMANTTYNTQNSGCGGGTTLHTSTENMYVTYSPPI